MQQASEIILYYEMDFTKGFTLGCSTKESHLSEHNGNCGQFMITQASIYVSFWVNKPIKDDWGGLNHIEVNHTDKDA